MNLSTPVKLLFDLLSLQSSPDVAERLSHLSADEWHELVSMATRQRARPLLYYVLKKNGLDANVPDEKSREIRDGYLRNAAANLMLYQELNRISTWFQDAGIPLIVLKGAHLAQVVYENIALREMGDLDILVPGSLIGPALGVLAAHGYRPLAETAASPETWLESRHHAAPLQRPGGPVVEVHATIDYYGAMAIEPYWERAATVRLGEAEILCLAPEDLLLHVCHHVAYHHQFCFGLRPFLDLAGLIDRFGNKLDWPTVARRAGESGWTRGVLLSLAVANSLLNAGIPADVLDLFRGTENGEPPLAAVVPLILDVGRAEKIANDMALFASTRTVGAKLKKVLKRIFLPARELAIMYPVKRGSVLIYWYYLTRLKDLLGRHGGLALKMMDPGSDWAALVRHRTEVCDWLGIGERSG